MADIKLALQKALAAALAGITAPAETTGQADVSVGVAFLDHPPDNAPLPLIRLERHRKTPRDAYDAVESEHEIEIGVWSRYRGTRQVAAIVAAIEDRLHDATLTLEFGQCLSARVSSSETNRDPDGTTYQGSVMLTAITAPEET